MWKLFALFSALFAALTSILAKFGIKNLNSNLGTAVKIFVVLILVWSIVPGTGSWRDLKNLTGIIGFF